MWHRGTSIPAQRLRQGIELHAGIRTDTKWSGLPSCIQRLWEGWKCGGKNSEGMPLGRGSLPGAQLYIRKSVQSINFNTEYERRTYHDE